MADDQNSRIEIEIVLDDGSVQKGFINLENMSNKTSKKVGDDWSKVKLFDFEGIQDKANKFFSKFGQDVLELGLVVGGALLVFEGLKETFDLALDGEKVVAVNSQFNILAKQAGIVGSELKEGLEKAADGLVDTVTLLKSANSAIINLGSSAAKLPQVLDLARKSAAILGGDVGDRFSGIVQGIENQNQKMLKSNGIIIDVDKALRDYAHSIGVGTGELDQAQRAQAVLNAVLDQGANKFKDVKTGVAPITDNFTRLKVAIIEAADSIGILFSRSQSLQIMSNGAKILGDSLKDAAKPDSVENLTKKIDQLKEKISETEKTANSVSFFGAHQREFDTDKLSKQKEQLEALNNELTLSKQINGEKIEADKLVTDQKSKQNALQLAKTQELTTKHLEVLKQGELEENQLALDNTQFTLSELQKREDQRKIFAERQKLIEEDAALQIKAIQESAVADPSIRQEEISNKILQIKQKEKSELDKIGQQKKKIDDDYLRNYAAHAERIGIITNGLKAAINGGVESFARSLLKGQLDFDDFAGSIVGKLGDMVIALGESLIIQGLGLEAFIEAINSLLPGSGAAAAAAGVGLVVFGTALKAMFGAKTGTGGSASVGGDISGGGVSSSSPTNQITKPDEIKRKDPDTYINVNIQGDVLDSHDTGLRMVDLINNAFDKNGVTIRRGLVG